jgi:hypothetical protein
MTSKQPETFNLHVPDAALADLRERLSRTRFPDQAPGEPWAYGTDLNWMAGFVDYWRDDFDWRVQEARLNSFPQYKVNLQGIDLHFMHVPGKGPDPHPLLLSHGWPGSVFEFLELIPRLTDPGRFGADPADAFSVVALWDRSNCRLFRGVDDRGSGLQAFWCAGRRLGLEDHGAPWPRLPGAYVGIAP